MEHKYYRIAQNIGGRKLWRIWRLIANPPKFYPPMFSFTTILYKVGINKKRFMCSALLLLLLLVINVQASCEYLCAHKLAS